MAEILIAGGFGFVGRRLGIALCEQGHKLTVLTRSEYPKSRSTPYPCKTLNWDHPISQIIEVVEKCDTIINLCGEGIVDKPWTQQQKQVLLESRILPIQALAKACKQAKSKPLTWVQASAIGAYGTTCPDPTHEEGALGQGYISELCHKWEETAVNCVPDEIRLINLRIGIVLGEEGGFIQKMTSLYSSSIGAALGSGLQKISYIHIEDLIRVFLHCINQEQLSGAVNATAPNPCTFDEFHQEMQKHFGFIQSPFKVPKQVIKLMMGERADLILADQNIIPQKVLNSGFKFNTPTIQESLEKVYPSIPGHRYGQILYDTVCIPAPIHQVWPFFSEAKNLEKLTPPWLNFKVLSQSSETTQVDSIIKYKLALHGIPIAWKTKILSWQPKSEFVDYQQKGPYHLWHHQHTFIPCGDQTIMTDRVVYKLPLHLISWPLIGWFVKKDVEKIFAFRKAQIPQLF